MKVVALAGYSGCGKTSLIERLIPIFHAQGLRASVVKHAHHGFDIDHPGKDSFRHRAAGAYEVLVASDQRLALLRDFEPAGQRSVHQLIEELSPGVDWVLVEGFKDCDLLKIEVWRAALGRPAQYTEDPFVTAIATDSPDELPVATLRPVLDLNAPEGVAAWLTDNQGRFEYRRETYA